MLETKLHMVSKMSCLPRENMGDFLVFMLPSGHPRLASGWGIETVPLLGDRDGGALVRARLSFTPHNVEGWQRKQLQLCC